MLDEAKIKCHSLVYIISLDVAELNQTIKIQPILNLILRGENALADP